MADGSTAYVSHDGDEGIAQVITAGTFGTPLSYNGNSATFDPDSDSGELHGIKGYFGAYESEIVTHVSEALTRKTAASVTAHSGLITATLTWGT